MYGAVLEIIKERRTYHSSLYKAVLEIIKDVRI
jgi:hypothetical protein